jgi:hypothetical protein
LEVEALRLQQRRESEASGGHKDSEELTLGMKQLEGQVISLYLDVLESKEKWS